MPVHKHSLLLVQYVDQPAVQVELSTAYPAMLPHNRTKLLQLEEIEDLLQETLQGMRPTFIAWGVLLVLVLHASNECELNSC